MLFQRNFFFKSLLFSSFCKFLIFLDMNQLQN